MSFLNEGDFFNVFDSFPNEIIFEIFSYMDDGNEIKTLRTVCHKFNVILSHLIADSLKLIIDGKKINEFPDVLENISWTPSTIEFVDLCDKKNSHISTFLLEIGEAVTDVKFIWNTKNKSDKYGITREILSLVKNLRKFSIQLEYDRPSHALSDRSSNVNVYGFENIGSIISMVLPTVESITLDMHRYFFLEKDIFVDIPSNMDLTLTKLVIDFDDTCYTLSEQTKLLLKLVAKSLKTLCITFYTIHNRILYDLAEIKLNLDALTIKFHYSFETTVDELEAFCTAMCKLKQLSITFRHHWEQKFNFTELCRILSNSMIELQHLSVNDIKPMGIKYLSKLPNFQSLTLMNVISDADSVINSIERYLRSLTYLELNLIRPCTLSPAFENMKKLRSLKINLTKNVGDVDEYRIIRMLTNLRELHLTGFNQLNECDIIDILLNCIELRTFIISCCIFRYEEDYIKSSIPRKLSKFVINNKRLRKNV